MNTRSVPLAVALLMCCTFASFADQNLQARLEKSLENLKSIDNLEIEFLDTYWSAPVADSQKEAFSRTFQYSYVASGQKIRTTCKLISGTQTNLAKLFVSAFDGTNYSTFNGDDRYLTQGRNAESTDRGHSLYNPLVAPFLFLTTHSDNCPQCILRPADLVSRNVTNRLTLPDGLSSGGVLEITKQGLPLAKQPVIWKITIDETGSSFAPKTIRSIIPGAGLEVVSHLLNYTNLGPYEFPSRIEWTMSSYPPTSPPTMVSTGTIALISARIPGQIADSVFRLDEEEKSAAVIWDWKQKTMTKMAPQLAKAQATHGNVRIVLLTILFTTVVGIIVIARRAALKNN